MSLVHDIQAAAISQDTDIPTLLRMCKLLAARISHQQFGEWVDLELNGYPSFDSLPDYRIVQVESYGSFIGSFARADRMQIPITVLPKDLQERYRYAYMGSGISAYTGLIVDDKSGSFQEAWPLNLAVHHASKVMRDMQCVSAWKEIPIGAVVRLLDSVKTRVLGYAIDLERESPSAGDTPIGGLPPLSAEKMTQIFNTNITGNVGNISNSGKGVSQTTNNLVQYGDWISLEKQLTALGFKHSDIVGMHSELQLALASGSDEEKSKAAESWIGRLATRAVKGVSGVGIEVAAAGVAKAIAAYLGLPGG
jgi:hypothetical protein